MLLVHDHSSLQQLLLLLSLMPTWGLLLRPLLEVSLRSVCSWNQTKRWKLATTARKAFGSWNWSRKHWKWSLTSTHWATNTSSIRCAIFFLDRFFRHRAILLFFCCVVVFLVANHSFGRIYMLFKHSRLFAFMFLTCGILFPCHNRLRRLGQSITGRHFLSTMAVLYITWKGCRFPGTRRRLGNSIFGATTFHLCSSQWRFRCG